MFIRAKFIMELSIATCSTSTTCSSEEHKSESHVADDISTTNLVNIMEQVTANYTISFSEDDFEL